jgi:hypothetical protein
LFSLPRMGNHVNSNSGELSSPEVEESIIDPVVARQRTRESRAATHAALKVLMRGTKVRVSNMGCTLLPYMTLDEITAATKLLIRQKASANALYVWVLGDVWNQIPKGYGDKTRALKKAGIPITSIQQIRSYAMWARNWPDESDRQKAGAEFFKAATKGCFSTKEKRRFLEDYTAKPRRVTTGEIAAEAKRRNEEAKAAGYGDGDYSWDDAEDEPRENEHNSLLLCAKEDAVMRQTARILKGTPEEYDMQRIISKRLCREQDVTFDQADFDQAFECRRPYPRPCKKAVVK